MSSMSSSSRWPECLLYHPRCSYNRNNKVPGWQELVVHLTTHRLLLLQALSEPTSSKVGLQTNMSYIRQTEFYVGFMRSSPKITLSLGLTPSITTTQPRQNTEQPNGHDEANDADAVSEWSCPVCGHSNTIGDRGYARAEDKCGLCGVTYGKSSAMGPNGRATPVSSSRPSTPKPSTASSSLPPSPSPGTPVPASSGETGITCPACTFLNHPSIRNCEICESPLPRNTISSTHRRQTSSSTPTLTDPGATGYEMIRLSFRGTGTGGKECYRRLKNVLSDKAWETRVTASDEMRNGDSTSRGVGIGESANRFLSCMSEMWYMVQGAMGLTLLRRDHAANDARRQSQGRFNARCIPRP